MEKHTELKDAHVDIFYGDGASPMDGKPHSALVQILKTQGDVTITCTNVRERTPNTHNPELARQGKARAILRKDGTISLATFTTFDELRDVKVRNRIRKELFGVFNDTVDLGSTFKEGGES